MRTRFFVEFAARPFSIYAPLPRNASQKHYACARAFIIVGVTEKHAMALETTRPHRDDRTSAREGTQSDFLPALAPSRPPRVRRSVRLDLHEVRRWRDVDVHHSARLLCTRHNVHLLLALATFGPAVQKVINPIKPSITVLQVASCAHREIRIDRPIVRAKRDESAFAFPPRLEMVEIFSAARPCIAILRRQSRSIIFGLHLKRTRIRCHTG